MPDHPPPPRPPQPQPQPHPSYPTSAPADPHDWARAIVDHAHDVLTAVDAAGRILYDSPSVQRVLGYAQGELLGRSAFALIHPDDLQPALDLLFEAASRPGAVCSMIFRFRHKAGHWRFLESVGTGVDGAGGVAIIVTSRDVTAQFRSVDAIRRTLGRVEHDPLDQDAETGEEQMEMLQRLARAAELRDDETGRHTRRVAELSARLAERLGLDSGSTRTIHSAAPLHDIGKIGVPDEILRKRGTLTPEEMRVMQTHTVLGGRILSGGRSALMRTAESIALYHHERWDGSGYPRGLKGREIPLPARIVAVADFFDALTHDRPYRRALPPENAAEAVAAGAAGHFDPGVAAAFLELDPPAAAAAENLQ